MEKYRLVDTSDKKVIAYDFVGFDDYTDFDKIVLIIKKIIKPINIDYQGWTAMHGIFDKDGLHVGLEYDEMIGNWLEFKGEQTEKNLAKVREWANIIFNSLMAGIKD